MSSESEDDSASPEAESDLEFDDMAQNKAEHASTDEKSLTQGKSDTKPASKSNAKDPNRTRRKKARRACAACQRAHLTCGTLVLNGPCFIEGPSVLIDHR